MSLTHIATSYVRHATPGGPAVAGRRLCRPPLVQLLAPTGTPLGLPDLLPVPDPKPAWPGGARLDSELPPTPLAPLGPGQWAGCAATRLAPLRVWWVLRSVAGRVVAVGSMRWGGATPARNMTSAAGSWGKLRSGLASQQVRQ